MKALAQFVQHDVRYVAIELGIGGWQPHSASDIFAHRYGDCKDKATLLSSMLEPDWDRVFLCSHQLRAGLCDTRVAGQRRWF